MTETQIDISIHASTGALNENTTSSEKENVSPVTEAKGPEQPETGGKGEKRSSVIRAGIVYTGKDLEHLHVYLDRISSGMEKGLELLISTLFLFVLIEFSTTLDGCAYDIPASCFNEVNRTLDSYNIDIMQPCAELRRTCADASVEYISQQVLAELLPPDVELCKCVNKKAEKHGNGSNGECTHYWKIIATVVSGILIILVMETLQIARHAKLYHWFTNGVAAWAIGVALMFSLDNCGSEEETKKSWLICILSGTIVITMAIFDIIMRPFGIITRRNFSDKVFQKWRAMYLLEISEDPGLEKVQSATGALNIQNKNE